MYDLKDSKKEKIKRLLLEEESFWQESANKIKVGAQTQKVFEKFRAKRYKKLFEMLDSDEDGKISADNINLSNVDERTLQVLSPLLEYLLNSGQLIGLGEFSDHLEELRNHLDLHSRSILFKRDPKIELVEMNPYPKLNNQTLEIAERIKTDENIYDRQVRNKIISQLKFEKKKELQQEMIIKDCSFKPKLIASDRFK